MFSSVRSVSLYLLSLSLFALHSGAASAQWTTGNSANHQRFESTAIEHEGKLILFNGFSPGTTIANSVEQYDPVTDKWTVLSTTEAGLGNAVTHAASVKAGEEVWLIGGRIGNHPGEVSDQVWIYDLQDNTWREGPELPRPFAGGGAGLVDNKIYLFGGVDSRARCDTDYHYVYDLNRGGEWQDITAVAAMPKARNHFSTVVFGKHIFAIGGWNNHGKCGDLPFHAEVDQVHYFDTESFQWHRVSNLPFVRSHAEPGTFIYNDLIYVIGGRARGDEVLTYDPREDEWQVQDALALPATIMAPAARIINGTLIVATGGENRFTNSTSTTRLLELPTHMVQVADEAANVEASAPVVPDPVTRQRWSDSYAVDGQCYCDTTYDHGIADIEVATPAGPKLVREICADIEQKLGAGPASGRLYYNTVQCGHEPFNLTRINDELICPGIPEADGQYSGPRCEETGPTWRLDLLYQGLNNADSELTPTAPVVSDASTEVLSTGGDLSETQRREEVVIRVNAGGPRLDAAGGDWMSDASASDYYNTGRTWSRKKPVDLSLVDADVPLQLFQSERFDTKKGAELSWSFPVVPGTYRVNLYFAEIYQGAQFENARVFDVTVEGLLLSDVDIYREAGGHTAMVKSLQVESDAILNIDFQRRIQNPAVKGIEIIRLYSAPVETVEETESTPIESLPEDQQVLAPDTGIEETTEVSQTEDAAEYADTDVLDSMPEEGTPEVTTPEVTTKAPVVTTVPDVQDDGDTGANTAQGEPSVVSNVVYRVNAGGDEIGDSPERWISSSQSKAFTGKGKGKTWSTKSAVSRDGLDTVVPESLFKTERWSRGDMAWEFPVVPGKYLVTLYLAENWAGAMGPGMRVFNIQVEDTLESNVDVFKEVGAHKALARQYAVQADDVINITLGKVKGNPSLKGIEIVDLNAPASLITPSPESTADTDVPEATVSVDNEGADTVVTTNTPAPAPVEIPALSAVPDLKLPAGSLFQPGDLLALHYDIAPDLDDIYAIAAGGTVTKFFDIEPTVVIGAYGALNNRELQYNSLAEGLTRREAANQVATLAFGADGYLDTGGAAESFETAANIQAMRWVPYLNAGRKVWIAEGGPMDFTRSVLDKLAGMGVSREVIKNQVFIVQHSRWNQRNTDEDSFAQVQSATSYIKIDDGNKSNGTSDLNTGSTPGAKFYEQATTTLSQNEAWAFALNHFRERLDFSDTVELLHILNIGRGAIADTADFADYFYVEPTPSVAETR